MSKRTKVTIVTFQVIEDHNQGVVKKIWIRVHCIRIHYTPPSGILNDPRGAIKNSAASRLSGMQNGLQKMGQKGAKGSVKGLNN